MYLGGSGTLFWGSGKKRHFFQVISCIFFNPTTQIFRYITRIAYIIYGSGTLFWGSGEKKDTFFSSHFLQFFQSHDTDIQIYHTHRIYDISNLSILNLFAHFPAHRYKTYNVFYTLDVFNIGSRI